LFTISVEPRQGELDVQNALEQIAIEESQQAARNRPITRN